MKKATLQLETLTCPSCQQKVEAAVKSVRGVEENSIKVLFNASKVKFDFDESVASLDDVEDAIEKVGFTVESAKAR